MAVVDVGVNLTEIAPLLPADVVQNINWLIVVLKAFGVVAVVYVVYVIIMGIFSFRRMKRLREIEEKVVLMDKKLDRLLRKKR
jgi:hypothetical protein